MRVRKHPLRVCCLILGLFPVTVYTFDESQSSESKSWPQQLNSHDIQKFNKIFASDVLVPVFDVAAEDVNPTHSPPTTPTPTLNFRDYKNPFSKDILDLPVPGALPIIEIPNIDFIIDDANETDANKTDIEIVDDLNETDANATDSIIDENKTEFSHTKENWKDIVSIIPTFTESETTPKNTDSELIPIRPEKQHKEIDSNHTTKQPLYKNPTDKNINEVDVPTFGESEHIPPRDTSEVIPEIPISLPKNDWELASEFDGGWKYIEWFGYYMQPSQTHLGNGWVFHETLGWLFLASDGFESVWMWNSNLTQWMWTSKDVFGCMYGDKTGKWVFYNSDKNVFFDYEREAWLTIKNL